MAHQVAAIIGKPFGEVKPVVSLPPWWAGNFAARGR